MLFLKQKARLQPSQRCERMQQSSATSVRVRMQAMEHTKFGNWAKSPEPDCSKENKNKSMSEREKAKKYDKHRHQ